MKLTDLQEAHESRGEGLAAFMDAIDHYDQLDKTAIEFFHDVGAKLFNAGFEFTDDDPENGNFIFSTEVDDVSIEAEFVYLWNSKWGLSIEASDSATIIEWDKITEEWAKKIDFKELTRKLVTVFTTLESAGCDVGSYPKVKKIK